MKRKFSKILGIGLILALLTSMLVTATPVAAADPETVVLGGDIATEIGAEGSSEFYIGSGSWHAVPGPKVELYIDPTVSPFDSLGTFTIDEIEKISFATKNAGTLDDVDFYFSIYTEWFDGGDDSWYGYRLTGEAMYSYNYNPIADQWNVWTTDAGPNEVVFSDHARAPIGFYGAPTLADIQADPIDWNFWFSGAPVTAIDYGVEIVKYITFATGNPWCETFEGNIDAITISLTGGASVTIDLEEYYAEVWVDDDADGDWYALPGNFENIQDGIDNVAESGPVNVVAGEYVDNVVIAKSLDLVGAGRETTTIDGNNVGNAITITASDVLVSGFTITGGTHQNILAPFGGVVVDGNGGISALTGITIEYNIIHGNDGNGIFVSAAGDGGEEGNIVIRKNEVYNNGLEVGSAGISLTYLWYGDCDWESWDEWRRPKNILVEENDVHGNNLYGIYLNSAKNCVIRVNELWGNSSKGLLLASSMQKCEIPSEYNKVEDNQIYNNACNGIKLVSFNHHNTFTGNNIYNNGYGATADYFKYGFQFKDGNDNTLEDNTIHGNAGGGLYLWGHGDPSYTWYSTTNNSITGNTIYDHSAGNGIYIPARTGHDNSGFLNSYINHNNITNNLDGLVNDDITQTIDATNNWWGTTDESDIAGMVSGDGDVNYTPWLPASFDQIEEGAVGSDDVSGSDPDAQDLKDDGDKTIAIVDISGAPGDAVGTIIASRYIEEPTEPTTSLLVGTRKAGVAFVDVQITGYTEGMATITVPYPDTDQDGIVDGTDILEHTLGLYYWEEWDEAGMWCLAANNNVDTVNNNVSGDIPVSALGGTPIGLGGSEALVAIDSILNLSNKSNPESPKPDTVELTIKTNTASLGATTIDLMFDPSVLEVLGVVENSSAFENLKVNLSYAVYGPDFQIARFLAYQTGAAGVDATVGAVVAEVQLKAVGSTMDFSSLRLEVITLKDNNLDIIPSFLGDNDSMALVGGVGDANRDTYVDSDDLVEITRAILGFPGYSIDTSTMNVDGKDYVDAADCTYLARHFVEVPDYPLPPDGWMPPWGP